MCNQSTVSTLSSFTVNNQFTRFESLHAGSKATSSKRQKIRVPAPAQIDSLEEAKECERAVQDERKLIIKAAIVRQLKASKTLSHNNLLVAVTEQTITRFTPSIAMIRRCIDQLIDDRYIEQSTNTPDAYNYVA